MRLWVVGKIRKQEPWNSCWEFQGVFDNKNKAIKACLNENYFIAPATLNKIISDKRTAWPNLIYPK
jgi:hypothetical protein